VVNNIEMRDTGVILKVTPRVNEQGSITLDIAQEVSDVAETTTSGINSPTIQQRRIASSVETRSGQMNVLGGLIHDRDTRGKCRWSARSRWSAACSAPTPAIPAGPS